MGIENLQVKLSGGASNTDPAASTGGVKSSTVVLSQTATFTAIAGITFVDAAGNTAGSGTLAYLATAKTLTWTPPGGTIGPAVYINANGRYLVRGGTETSGYLIVDVVSASLPASTDYSRTVTVANQVALFLPPVSKDTAFTGATDYHLFYLDNIGATTIKSVQIQIEVDTSGVDTLSIDKIATKNTTEAQGAASGHSYSAVGVNVVMGDLLTTDYWGFWIKRVIPNGTVDGVVTNTFKIRVTSLT